MDGRILVYWKSDSDGRACNRGSRDFTAYPGLIQKIPGPLVLCGSGALHGTTNPEKWTGSRTWLVALSGEVIWDNSDTSKCGALEREILKEIK